MDASTIQAAYTGLKFAIESLRTVAGTKAQIAADARVVEALEQLGKVQDTLFELRNSLSDLQQENFALREKMREQEMWDARAAKYSLVTAQGGAHVYRSDGPPPHFACPRCFEDRKIQILQDRNVSSGSFDCPGCRSAFDVGPVRTGDLGYRRPPWTG